MGFTYALSVTSEAVVSYTTLPPLPDCSGGSFLLHFPWSRLHRTLSGILPYEARTFLTCGLSTLAAAIIQSTCRYRLTHFQLCVKFTRELFSIRCNSSAHRLHNSLIHASMIRLLYCLWLNCYYTLKQLPPMNSRKTEFGLTPSAGIGRK